jgi:hypothetical protein
VIAMLAAVVAVTCSPVPASSQLASVSPLPVGELADPPPAAVQTRLAQGGMGFRPLTGPELALVRVSAAQAKRVALAQPPAEYGKGGKIVWTKVGCIFLGSYTPRQMPVPNYVPQPFPAYVVQVIGAPVPAFPGYNIQAIVIMAETGRVAESFSSSGTVLGTTCGVSL